MEESSDDSTNSKYRPHPKRNEYKSHKNVYKFTKQETKTVRSDSSEWHYGSIDSIEEEEEVKPLPLKSKIDSQYKKDLSHGIGSSLGFSKRAEFIARQITGRSKYDLDILAKEPDNKISDIGSSQFSSINELFDDERIIKDQDALEKKQFYMPNEYIKLYEDNSHLRYRVMRLQDQILILEQSLGATHRANLQKMKNYATQMEFNMEKEYKQKLDDIVRFYKKEIKDILKQYNKGRMEATTAHKIVAKLISMNLSQEMFILEIRNKILEGDSNEAANLINNQIIESHSDMFSKKMLRTRGIDKKNIQQVFTAEKIAGIQGINIVTNEGKPQKVNFKSKRGLTLSSEGSQMSVIEQIEKNIEILKKKKEIHDAENKKRFEERVINNPNMKHAKKKSIPDEIDRKDRELSEYILENDKKMIKQLKFEIDTLENMYNTILDENKYLSREVKSLKDEMILTKKRMKDEFQIEKDQLNQKVEEYKHKWKTDKEKNAEKVSCFQCELKLQDKIFDRLKKYVNVLKKELVMAKNIIKDPRNKNLR
ncbi:unnamed protein product [Moneuplotes crassus]|uniref:Uncharacterized protein n=1 Tax=Euplotes crassus TaxID=5936 RepID=A0AAD2D9L2_EUPCR|nr:unnamed protein product [Moneuplotes crassus]